MFCKLGAPMKACGYLNQRRQLHIPFICYKNNEQKKSNEIHLARLNSIKVLAVETLSQFIVLQCIIQVVCRSIVIMVLEILD